MWLVQMHLELCGCNPGEVGNEGCQELALHVGCHLCYLTEISMFPSALGSQGQN